MQSYNKGGNFKRGLLDPDFDFEKAYFFKEVSATAWAAIKIFLDDFFSKGKTDEKTVHTFFDKYPNLKKGSVHVTELRKMVDEIAAAHKSVETFYDSFKAVNDYICTELMTAKPAVLECTFFPNEAYEDKVINMLRTCKNSLDVAIFTITNDKIFAALEEVWNAGVDVRIITDDECCKQLGSDIYKLAAIVNYFLTPNREYL
jgi:hypothetical protein